MAALRAANPYLAFAEALELLTADETPRPACTRRASSRLTRSIGVDVSIGPFVVIGAGARIGDRAVLHPHVVIGRGVSVGARLHPLPARLGARAVRRRRARHPAGRRRHRERRLRVRDASRTARSARSRSARVVVIEDDVEIGANTTIDRPAVGRDAHRGRARRSTTSCRSRTASGSARTRCWRRRSASPGARCWAITSRSQGRWASRGTSRSATTWSPPRRPAFPTRVEPAPLVSGYPAIPNREWLKSSAVVRRLPELRRQLTRAGRAPRGARSASR